MVKPPTTDALSAWVRGVMAHSVDVLYDTENKTYEDFIAQLDADARQRAEELLDKLLVPALDAAIRETMNVANANNDLLRGALIAMTVQKLREMVIK